MWDLPGPVMEPTSPALAVRLLTTGPPGKSLSVFLKHYLIQWNNSAIRDWIIDRHITMDESPKDYAEWKLSDTKQYMLCSLNLTLQKGKNKPVVTKSRSMIKWDQSELYTDEGMLWGFGRHYISCGVVITWMAVFFKISQNLQLKWMHFIVYN